MLPDASALTFRLSFETAQFKKHLIKLYRDTYIAPLPSAILGIVGAIVGVRRRELKEFACKKGILAGAVLLTYEGTVNETMTVVKMKNWREYIRTPKRSVLLYRPEYKVAVASSSQKLMKELEERISRLDFEFEIFGGNDYNFLSWIGCSRKARLVRTKEGQGYYRLTDLKGMDGSGIIHIDEVNESEVVKYAFGQGVTFKLKREALAVDDSEHLILVHETWKFLK